MPFRPYGKSGILASAYPDGTTVFDGVRNPILGDGYYEAKILFPDGEGRTARGQMDQASLEGLGARGGC
jgi:hypothetical protein